MARRMAQASNYQQDDGSSFAAAANQWAESQSRLNAAMMKAVSQGATNDYNEARAAAVPQVTDAKIKLNDAAVAEKEAHTRNLNAATDAVMSEHDLMGVKGGKDTVKFSMDVANKALEMTQKQAMTRMNNARADQIEQATAMSGMSGRLDMVHKALMEGKGDQLEEVAKGLGDKKLLAVVQAMKKESPLDQDPLIQSALTSTDPAFRDAVVAMKASDYAKKHGIPQFINQTPPPDPNDPSSLLGGTPKAVKVENPDYAGIKTWLGGQVNALHENHFNNLISQAQTMTERDNVQGEEDAKGKPFKKKVEGGTSQKPYGKGNPSPTQGFEATDPTGTMLNNVSTQQAPGVQAPAGQSAGSMPALKTFDPKGQYNPGDMVQGQVQGQPAKLKYRGNNKWEVVE